MIRLLFLNMQDAVSGVMPPDQDRRGNAGDRRPRDTERKRDAYMKLL